MIALELSFTSTPQRLAARPAHRQILERLHKAGTLIAAGPWGDDSGALLVFETDANGIQEIISQDPYYDTAGVSIESTREWNTIVGPN